MAAANSSPATSASAGPRQVASAARKIRAACAASPLPRNLAPARAAVSNAIASTASGATASR